MPQVFILSSPRSGSTVTRLTLDKLPGLVALPETHFWIFKKLHGNRSITTDLNGIVKDWIEFYTVKKIPVDHQQLTDDLLKHTRTWNDILEITIEHYLRTKGITGSVNGHIVCEKSPPHIFHTKEILNDYPDSKFIFLIRDPRDVIASLKTCSWSTTNPVVNSLVWRNGTDQMWEGKNAIVIRYEDLVSKPDEVLKKVCSFLNIVYDDKILHSSTVDQVEQKNHTSANALKPISGDFIGGYRNKLSGPDRERDIVEFICAKKMDQYGYERNKNLKRKGSLRLRVLYHKFGIFIAKLTR